MQKCSVIAPGSRLGPVTPDEQNMLIKQSIFFGRYEKAIDRESAYELLTNRAENGDASKQAAAADKKNAAKAPRQPAAKSSSTQKGLGQEMKEFVFGSTGPRGGKKDGLLVSSAKSAARSVTTSVMRGMLGSLVGKK